MKKILALLGGFFIAISSFAQSGSVLVKNATIITVAGENVEGDLLVVDGKIKDIGSNLSAPNGAETIDATGKFVMPGILDAHSHIAVTQGINEWTHPVTAEVTMEDVIDPNDVSIYRALAGGVTIAHVMHGSANVIGGQGETIKLRYGLGQDGLKMESAPRTIKFALGENPTRVHGIGRGLQPRTRMAVEQVIREHFDAAIDYKRARTEYVNAKSAYDKQRRKKGNAPVPVARNERFEVLNDILDGKVLVHCHSYRADEIHMLMRVFNDYGVKNYTLQHILEGFKVAPELAKNNAYASTFADWWAYKFEVYYSTAYNTAVMVRNGVNVSINSDSEELIRHLNHEAAKVVKYGGLTEEEALQTITINPAKQLGIDKFVGTLEKGKDGDFAIWSAHPLSIYAVCEKTFVDGVKRFDKDSDPADMRLTVNVEQDYESPSLAGRDADACMRDVMYFFDGSTTTENHTNHNH